MDKFVVSDVNDTLHPCCGDDGCHFDCTYCVPTFKAQARRQKKNCMRCYGYEPHEHPDPCLHAHVTALAVSQALGHTSTEVTFGHYADRGIVDQQQHAQALSVLATTVPSHQN
jgi:hypothetical protein